MKMLQQLNNAQKRGLLIGLVALVLLAGWRWRASQRDLEPALAESIAEKGSAKAGIRVELNTADTTLLQTVKGIGPASARRIVKYRALVGGFTQTDQLLKVWGITPENFIRIEEQVYVDTTTAAFAELKKGKFVTHSRPNYPNYAHRNPSGGHGRSHGRQDAASTPEASNFAAAPQPASDAPAKAIAPRQPLDINTADSTALVAISGIGPATARNIVKYRSLIFFFDSIDQLAEVWGIHPENLDRMKPHLSVGAAKHSMPHLKINEMGVDELGKHKYLGYKEARILVSYRDLHGRFADFAALQKVLGIAPEKLEKLKPYLLF
ncbi:MAG TPA: helix-hairpin-helix domain-containing protein [Bacteroidia bacterium]|jgi:competence ComEA-like helix-hairpin-helix protein|nr:helix-hairpin-helix domain-containing protein [Bacteroidia bacterium]